MYNTVIWKMMGSLGNHVKIIETDKYLAVWLRKTMTFNDLRRALWMHIEEDCAKSKHRERSCD